MLLCVEAYSADGGTLRSDSLTTPLDITLSETDVVLLLVYRHHFSGIGILLKAIMLGIVCAIVFFETVSVLDCLLSVIGVEFEAVDNSDIIKVHRVPACIISSATADIIKVRVTFF